MWSGKYLYLFHSKMIKMKSNTWDSEQEESGHIVQFCECASKSSWRPQINYDNTIDTYRLSVSPIKNKN